MDSMGSELHTENHSVTQEWERLALGELYQEYEFILRRRRLKLRPAAIELFDSSSHWGEWNAQTRTIRLARNLLQNYPWFSVLGILAHEMAHQWVDEGMGRVEQKGTRAHGEIFKRACEKLGVPAEFSSAAADLQANSPDWRSERRADGTERLLERVRKLLALATSSNENEAVAAMNKVRELYARYNLEGLEQNRRDGFVHLVISTKSKRTDLFEKKVIGILVGYFFVQAIMGKSYDVATAQHFRSIEIIGTRENALMAEYVYHFLINQIKMMVDQRARTEGLSRLQRKSYRLGILSGFAEKLEQPIGGAPGVSPALAPEDLSQSEVISRAMIAFNEDKELDSYIRKVYPSLRILHSRSNSIDGSSYAAGIAAGHRLQLNRAMTSKGGNLGRLLTS